MIIMETGNIWKSKILPSHTSRLRVGYVMQNGAPDLDQVSGPQLHTLAVITGFKNPGHSVRILAYQKKMLGWTDDLQGWSPPQFGFTRSLWFRTVESAIRRIQSELHLPYLGFFDSLHFADACRNHLKECNVLYERHGYMGFGGVIAARMLRIPLILELNGNIVREIDQRGLNLSPVQRRLGRWITVQTFLAADRIVVVSNALKEVLERELHIPGEKISVVQNGVNIELFEMNQDTQDTRARYGINGSHIVSFVGSFEPWHGVDLLVSAFREVVHRIPDSKLLLVGDGQQKDMTIRETKRLGLEDRVMFLGRLPQDQVASILGISHVVVAPYPFEYSDIVGSPLKLVEYMASGKGIIASTAPIHEIIENGVTGLRVPPADAIALAEGIIRLLENDSLRRMLGKNAADRAKQYSWDGVAKKLIQIAQEEISHTLHTGMAGIKA
jgi:glycosyltransferase involved in cell wall biosynthesis